MMIPIIQDVTAAIKTAAAPKSFAFFAKGCISLVLRSVRFSIAEFNASVSHTIPTQNMSIIHSYFEILNQVLSIKTQNVAKRCILA